MPVQKLNTNFKGTVCVAAVPTALFTRLQLIKWDDTQALERSILEGQFSSPGDVESL